MHQRIHDLNVKPPLPVAVESIIRRVGIEVEFFGPSARDTAAFLARALGGTLEREDAHAFAVHGTRFGSLRIEMDLRHLHPQRHPSFRLRLSPRTAAGLGALLSPFVPREVILEPIAFAEVPEIDDLVALLHAAGARGRGVALVGSLGLHFNIDAPLTDAETLTRYLKAFLLVSDAQRRQVGRGSHRLRRALPADYPDDYRRRVLDPSYWPDLAQFMDDYLAANPTRKRALDLLPILAFLDERRVRAAAPADKIAPRPVFHYRLPQAHLSEPGWSIVPDWKRWLVVERLAADRDALCICEPVPE